jgi:predicted regulator of Ras-like GTPase activity (Roadblock/LC7/MglB family)
MSEAHGGSDTSRSGRLDRILTELVGQVPEIEAASVVSFDGLAMASALPQAMDEDRVAAMSAALLSLGERAAEGLGRGLLSQVYVEGEDGTVFLISADDEAVLVAVAAKGAKTGLMLFEVRRAAAAVGEALKVEVEYGAEPVSDETDSAHPVEALAPVETLAPVEALASVEALAPAGHSAQDYAAAEDQPASDEPAPLHVVARPVGYDLPFDATTTARPGHSDAPAWS